MLVSTLESPLDRKVKPVNPKRNQPFQIHWKDWCEAEAEVLILWSLDAKGQLTGKDPDSGKD